ncbi:NADPH--cytochrome P450 reductase [Daktulosphaira vitifoliae]|uniref:NADPH--cytochrome P450 reductase n=1 Tax=Daktulosphaira vitifoliae TaxID=58002 RepID=UPI0021AAA8D4|nr:NADPH--cytochrome P450 reductase [Daktulosphaira vitifoliae]XP_050531791.1 NADPH--cytochrome P450 reductase [Daktulosphaira vitifoliae]
MENSGSIRVEQAVVSDEPLISALDIALFVVIMTVAYFWYFKREKQSNVSEKKLYTIQPSTINSIGQTSNNSFIKKLKSTDRSLVVFYGSQTGTAEEFAGRIAKEGARYKMKGMVADPEECDMADLVQMKEIQKSLAIFCLATYGEGDPTDNAMEFYEWLQNGDADLEGLNYAVFGLGNKTYEHYNEVAIYVDQRLEELGATRVHEIGLGDDDANIEDDFVSWKEKLWENVCAHYGIEEMGEEANVRQYKSVDCSNISLDRIYNGEISRLKSYENQRFPFDVKNPYLAPILINRELHKSGGRSCMHIEFNIDGSKMRYDTGDHVAVYPKNSSELVEKLGQLLNVNLDIVFSLLNTDEESSKKHPFPCPCTYRTALTYYLDITSNPRTHIMKELAEYATDPKEQEKLKLMASSTPEGKKEFHEWVLHNNRNIVHILEDLPSVKPDIDHLCELLPRLQCRYYSISSSPKVYPKSIHITAVKVEYETPTSRINRGVATNLLSQLKPKENEPLPIIPVFIRRSQFRLPPKSQTPIIMIGPGTGLAPFRGFIQERDFARKEGREVGKMILYFGCRKKEEDFIYEDELKEYVSNGTLTKLHLAFSRDQPEKQYVTHLLEQNADELWNVIGENNGHLYVCGDARSMAKDVHAIIVKVVMEKGQMTNTQALNYVKKMEQQKRYSADVWS